MTKEIREVIIVKGWYNTVGKKYGWISDGYECRGVGLNRELFKSDEIHVTIEKKKYVLDTKEAMDFIRKYKSHSKIDGAEVGYVSKSLLKRYATEG